MDDSVYNWIILECVSRPFFQYIFQKRKNMNHHWMPISTLNNILFTLHLILALTFILNTSLNVTKMAKVQKFQTIKITCWSVTSFFRNRITDVTVVTVHHPASSPPASKCNACRHIQERVLILKTKQKKCKEVEFFLFNPLMPPPGGPLSGL